MSLAKRNINLYLMPCHDCVRIIYLYHHRCIVALTRLSKFHNSNVGHWGLDICIQRLREASLRQGERGITDRMISKFIRQCPACQVMSRMRLQIHLTCHRFTCASYNSFEVLHLDHIEPLTTDANGNEYILDRYYCECFKEP